MVCYVYGGGKGGVARVLEIFSIFPQVSKGAVAKDSVRFRNTAVACFTSFLGRFGGNGSTAFPRPYLLVEGVFFFFFSFTFLARVRRAPCLAEHLA